MIPVAIAILALSVVVNLILFRLYTRRYRDEIDNLTCELDRRNVYIAELQRRCERLTREVGCRDTDIIELQAQCERMRQLVSISFHIERN